MRIEVAAVVRLVAAELGKLFTTRLWLWLLLGSVALTLLYASLAIAFGDDPDNPSPPLSSPEGQRTVFSVSQGAGALVAVLGAIGSAGEFRHHTATMTFLATPRRARVLLAKLISYPVIGAGYAVVCLAATSTLAVIWLSTKGIQVSPWTNGIPDTMAGVVIAVALFAALGVGLGAVLREQVATVVGLLIYLFLAEPVVTRIPALQHWTIYLPGSASGALTRISQADQRFLAPWQGGLVLTGYALALAALAALVTIRRDVT